MILAASKAQSSLLAAHGKLEDTATERSLATVLSGYGEVPWKGAAGTYRSHRGLRVFNTGLAKGPFW